MKENHNIHAEAINATHTLFISRYHALFNKSLSSISDSTKSLIRGNKDLNNLYDLFLDFIIDSSQHLDYINAKRAASDDKEI